MKAKKPVTSNAKRVAEWRARQAAKGFITVTVQVPLAAAADFTTAATEMQLHPHLTLGCLRDSVSHKFVSLNGSQRDRQ